MIRHSGRLTLAIALCAVPALSTAAAAQQCATEQAVYEMAEGGEARLTFETPEERQGYSDLSLVVTAGEPAQRFIFWLTQAQGYGNTYAIPYDETLSEDGILVFYLQRNGERLVPYEGEIPSSGDPAPDAIFLPQIGTTLWYGTNGSRDAVSIPTEIWYLSECRNG